MNIDCQLIYEAYKRKQIPPPEPEDEQDTEITLPDGDTGGEIVVRPDYKPEPEEDKDTDIEDGDIEDGDVEDGDIEDGDVEDGDVEDGDVEDGDVEDGDVEDGDVEDKPELPSVKSIPKETPQPNSGPQSPQSGGKSTGSSSGSGFPRNKCEDKDEEELCDLYYSLRKGSEGNSPEAQAYRNKFNKFQKTCGDLIDKFNCDNESKGPGESKPKSEPQSTPKPNSKPNSNPQSKPKPKPKTGTSSKPNSKPQSKPEPTASTNTEDLTEWDHMFNYIFLSLYNDSDDSDFREFLSFAATYFQPREHDFRKDFIVQQEVNLAKIEKVIEVIKTQTRFGYRIDYILDEKLKHLKQLMSHFKAGNKINKPMSPKGASAASLAAQPRQKQETQAEKNRREHREFMDMWKMAQ